MTTAWMECSLNDWILFEDKKDLEDDGLNEILSQSLDLIEERINCVESRSLVESIMIDA